MSTTKNPNRKWQKTLVALLLPVSIVSMVAGAYFLVLAVMPVSTPGFLTALVADAVKTYQTPALKLSDPTKPVVRGTAIGLTLTGVDTTRGGKVTYQSNCFPNVMGTTSVSVLINAEQVSDVCAISALLGTQTLAALSLSIVDAPTLTQTYPSECFSSRVAMSVTPGIVSGVSGEYQVFTLCSAVPVRLQKSMKILIEKGGSIKLYTKVDTVDPIMLWESGTSADCSNNACRLRLQSDGNLVLYRSDVPLWGSNTYGTSLSLLLGDSFPFIAVVRGHALIWSPTLGKYFTPKAVPQSLWGWVGKIYQEDGVIEGGAVNGKNLAESLTVKIKIDGKDVGSTIANAVSQQWLYDYGLLGSYNFRFRIPDQYQNGATHSLEIVAVSGDGSTLSVPGPTSVKTFSVKTNGKVSEVNNTSSCLTPGSQCVSDGYDFGAPNYTEQTGWSDGKNYFNEWKCTSSAGFTNIARLNIIPLGTHGPKFQKDSMYMNEYEKLIGGAPTIYFSTTRHDFHTMFALKKAAYDSTAKKWNIYDVLDYPSNDGGFSSQDGVYPNYILQDYSIAGLGPVSPLPGSTTKIPSVSNTPQNPEKSSYALEGVGPLGLTTIRYFGQTPDPSNGAVSGRTCIHWNPKLFEYDSTGVPHAFLTYLSLGDYTKPCTLPNGKQVLGWYVYRADPKLGWQLDLSRDPAISRASVVKLLWGTKSTFVAGDWDGTIFTNNLETGKKQTIIDCTASGARFAEVSGGMSGLVFGGVPPGTSTGPGLDPRVVTGDIYYAFK